MVNITSPAWLSPQSGELSDGLEHCNRRLRFEAAASRERDMATTDKEDETGASYG